ncbi:hypothetical protein [Roseivirga sp.]|uniref:hypothetical protein n=1 Tax=Roseivirga sp. TaxID=1964215 RepID=UPI003B8E489D
MIRLLKNNSNVSGFLLWFLLTLIVFAFINPFDIAIWRDRAYLMYMSQTIARGTDLYATTPFGYTPLAAMVAGGIMSAIRFLNGTVDTILVSRLMGMGLYACIIGSLFVLGRTITGNKRSAHLLSLLFLGFLFFSYVSAVNFEPKFLALLLQIWAMYSLVKTKHLQAGIFFSLAAMCWQPMVINCLVVIPFYLSIEGFTKSGFQKLSLFSLGVVAGTIPVLFYLSITNDWIHFWNQAVLRKTGYEGNALLDAPLAWLLSIINPKLLLDSIPILIGFLGVFLIGLNMFLKKPFLKTSLPYDGTLRLLYFLFFGWFFFNAMEFQGPMDLIPLLPVMLIFAILLMQKFITKLSSSHFRLVVVIVGIYALFDFALPLKQATFTEQKEYISDLKDRYGDAFVINFEEYYVLQQKPMPLYYMRMALFEDHLIDRFEPGGCAAILSQVKEMKPDFIISRRTTGQRMSSIGKCGQKVLDTFSTTFYDTHEIASGQATPIKRSNKRFTYDVYKTQFHSITLE